MKKETVSKPVDKKTSALALILAIVAALFLLSCVIFGIVWFLNKNSVPVEDTQKTVIGDGYVHPEDVMVNGRAVVVDWPDEDFSDYVELGDYQSLAVTATAPTLSEEDVDSLILGYLESFDKCTRITEGELKDGDYVEVSYTGYVNGKAMSEFSGSNAHFYLKDDLEPIEFYENLVGAQIGKEVTFTVQQSSVSTDANGDQYLEYYDVETTCKVSAVIEFPEVTEETVSELTNGEYTTVSDFRAFVKDAGENYYYNQYVNDASDEIVSQLISKSHFKTVPESLQKWGVALHLAYYQSLADMAGKDIETYCNEEFGVSLKDLCYTLTSYSNEAVQRYAVLDAVAKAEGLEYNESDETDVAMMKEQVAYMLDEFQLSSEDELVEMYGYQNMVHDVQNIKVLNWFLKQLENE